MSSAVKPIRILQVVTVMNRGGLETMLMNYYRRIDRSRVQFDFMVHRAEQGHYDEEIMGLGGRIYRMPPIRPGNYRAYFRMLDDFFTENPGYKVVHSHLNENSSFVLRAAARAGVVCRIAHSHLSDLGIDFKLPFRLYARWILKHQPNRYFACSAKAGRWLFGKRRTDANGIKVLNNAVNVEEFRYNQAIRELVRAELDAGERLVLGHVGRFVKQKNHEFLIDIFKSVQARKQDSLLVLVGDGPMHASIESKVNRLGLAHAVRFLGVRADIAQLMLGMDLFVFPSLFEGLPVVLIEAQASGLNSIVASSITREADITGRVQFMDLQASTSRWADAILHTSTERQDTSSLLRNSGYDVTSMADWLTQYYEAEWAMSLEH